MSKLFPKHTIDLDKGKVFSKKYKRFIGSFRDGYYECSVFDSFGNRYTKIHQIIYAEAYSYPKHLWPFDEKGQRFEVDHIIPVENGGTDNYKNLRLCSKKDNSNNILTKINQSTASKKRIITNEWKENLSISHKKAWDEGKYKFPSSFIEGGKKYSEKKKIKIYQYSSDWELVGLYIGRNTVAKETGFNRERITYHLNDGKLYKGYYWRTSPI